MAGRIVLFGATGYTGELTARAMVARGLAPVLAARSASRVDALASELGGLETRVADVGRPDSVRALVERGDVLVSTVGPFMRWGEPAVQAAVDAGAHYLDSTGEGPFIREVFDRFGALAERAGCGLLTAMGYDWVPGNLAAALALREAGPAATRVDVGYFITGRGSPSGMSGGTRASAQGVFFAGSHTLRDGHVVAERGAKRVRSFEVGGRARQAISVGSSEQLALPRVHPSLRDCDVYLGWFGPASRAMSGLSLAIDAFMHVPGGASLLGRLGERATGSTGGPGPEERAKTRSAVVAEARAADGEVLAEVRLEGVNGYDFTAAMLAWGAATAAAGGLRGSGALGPVDGYGLDELEEGAREAGIARAG
jgi:short subunit dehydrogenase-like uncharacterized protein